MLFRDGNNQILSEISSKPIPLLVQYSGRLLIYVVGSNIENTFLVIFSLLFGVDDALSFAGFGTNFEYDRGRVIALSPLSQFGLMIITLNMKSLDVPSGY